jgi:hypothetical protein
MSDQAPETPKSPTPPQHLECDKVFELYENGKERRYKLLFAVNGGAYALVGYLMEKAKADTRIAVWIFVLIPIALIFYTGVMCLDIHAFGKRMRKLSCTVCGKHWMVYKSQGRNHLIYLGLILGGAWLAAVVCSYPQWAGAHQQSIASGPPPERPTALGSAPATVAYTWSQLVGGPDGQAFLLARAIVPLGQKCPDLTVDGTVMKMEDRVSPAREIFPVTTCEQQYAPTRTASVGGRTLPRLPEKLSRILVIGDTGCRIVHYRNPQACEHQEEWPFRQMAAMAAMRDGFRPELVVHVGDYHYREAPCDDTQVCGAPVYGDNWATWQREFFDPADELLRVAPWMMLRGNHEDCNRAGTGWFFFMSPTGDRPKRGCKSVSDPYYIKWNDLVMGVLDSAHTGDGHEKYADVDENNNLKSESDLGKPNRFWRIAEMVDRIKNDGARNVWLLTHHPLWVLLDKKKDEKPVPIEQRSLTAGKSWNDPRAFITERSAGIDLILSGDTHAFEAVIPTAGGGEKWPAQLVVGTGGTALEPKGFPGLESPVTQSDWEPPEHTIWSSLSFGFVMLTRSADEWHAAFFDPRGNKKFDCTVIAKERKCE